MASITGCVAGTPPPSAPTPPAPPPAQATAAASLAAVTDLARADAAKRTGLKPGDLKVLSAEAVTWPDGALGCPEPGMMYTQALVPGYRVKIQASIDVMDYHAGRGGVPSLCPAERAQEPVATEALR